MNSLPPAFNRLAVSNLMAQSAEQLTLAAVPIVAVLMLQAGPGEIGVIAALQSLPFLLLSIPLGLLADRSSLKRLMVASEVLRVLALMVLVTAVFMNQVSVILLAGVGFIASVGTVGFSVGAPSLVPALVGSEHLARANGRLELARSMAFAAGPALAGALIAWAGASTSFVLSLILSLNAVLLPIMLTSIAWNISWFVLQAIYVPYAIKSLGMSASQVGMTLACFGVGMMLGSLSAAKVVSWMPFGRAILVGPFFSVAAAMLMALTIWTPLSAVAGLSYFLFGFGPIIWTITSTTLRQTVTPFHMMGRVTAINIVVGTGARPIGALLGGFVGENSSDLICLLLVVAGFGIQAIIISTSKVRKLRSLNESDSLTHL
ncbi:MAG: MFS transporter [Burkholderiales bacterium]|nr:MFS transporter [Burkholderiales bacterium]